MTKQSSDVCNARGQVQLDIPAEKVISMLKSLQQLPRRAFEFPSRGTAHDALTLRCSDGVCQLSSCSMKYAAMSAD